MPFRRHMTYIKLFITIHMIGIGENIDIFKMRELVVI